jgi:putative flippase GtrA
VSFVFRSRRVDNRALEFTYFVALGLAGMLVNAVVLSLAIAGLGLDLMPAKLLAAICTFFSNFLLRRTLLFSSTRTV